MYRTGGGRARHSLSKRLLVVAAMLAIGGIIMLVFVKVRNERDTFTNGGDPTMFAAPPQPSMEQSGTVMAGTVNPHGQALLLNSIPTPEPCVVDGVMMPLHFKTPNKHQSASVPANSACVIDVTYPGAVKACTDSQSTFYDQNAVKSVNIVTDSSDASSTMQCMIAFQNDVPRDVLQRYATKNDLDAQKAMLVQANQALQVQNQQLGTQYQQLQALHAELQSKSAACASAPLLLCSSA